MIASHLSLNSPNGSASTERRSKNEVGAQNTATSEHTNVSATWRSDSFANVLSISDDDPFFGEEDKR